MARVLRELRKESVPDSRELIDRVTYHIRRINSVYEKLSPKKREELEEVMREFTERIREIFVRLFQA